MRRVRPVHADDTARIRHGQLDRGDRDAGGVARQDGAGGGEPVQVGEDRRLDLRVLLHRLDDQAGAGDCLAKISVYGHGAPLRRGSAADPVQHGVRRGHLAGHPVAGRLAGVEAPDVHAAPGQRGGHSRTHRPGADDGYPCYVGPCYVRLCYIGLCHVALPSTRSSLRL
jgi:hypothetical protein